MEEIHAYVFRDAMLVGKHTVLVMGDHDMVDHIREVAREHPEWTLLRRIYRYERTENVTL